MLLRLRKSPSQKEIQPLLDLAEELGYSVRTLDAARTLVELTHPDAASTNSMDRERAAHRSRFEDVTCVQAVLEHRDAPELVERAAAAEETIVRAGQAVIGGGNVSVIAGPCAVENEEQLLEVAQAVRAAGATLLRGGAFKPRTSPYAFQGLGAEGLELLRAVGSEVGLGIVTEVLDPRDVELVAASADALQIGSRSMSNSALLRAAAGSGLPILLKRGLAATVREFLLAAETILSAGNPHVILCERGIRGFDTVTRNILDLGTVAHLKRATHLPVIVDPSHAAGRAELVPPLSKASILAGADGLILEVHHAPESVHSDGAQALSPAVFRSVVDSVASLCELEGRVLVRPTAGFTPSASKSTEPPKPTGHGAQRASATPPAPTPPILEPEESPS